MTDSVGLSKVATIANAVYNSITANNTAVTGMTINGAMTLTATNNDIRVNIINYGPSSTPRYPGLIVTHYTSNATGGDVGGYPVIDLTRYGGNTSFTSATPSGLTLGGFNTWGSNSTSALSATRIEGISEAAFTTTATAGIRFLTTNAGTQAERMRISAAGQVTKPYQAALRLNGNNSTTVNFAGGAQLLTATYYDVQLARGDLSWNSSTGAITVTTPGYYFIMSHVYVLVASSNGNGRIFITKNGSGYQLSQTGFSGDTTITSSVIMNLAAGDYVNMVSDSFDPIGLYMGPSHTSFNMFLLG